MSARSGRGSPISRSAALPASSQLGTPVLDVEISVDTPVSDGEMFSLAPLMQTAKFLCQDVERSC